MRYPTDVASSAVMVTEPPSLMHFARYFYNAIIMISMQNREIANNCDRQKYNCSLVTAWRVCGDLMILLLWGGDGGMGGQGHPSVEWT